MWPPQRVVLSAVPYSSEEEEGSGCEHSSRRLLPPIGVVEIGVSAEEDDHEECGQHKHTSTDMQPQPA